MTSVISFACKTFIYFSLLLLQLMMLQELDAVCSATNKKNLYWHSWRRWCHSIL